MSVPCVAHGAGGILSAQDREEVFLVASTPTWSAGPSNRVRLFVDFYNDSDFFDSEPHGDPRFFNKTQLSDTLRPVATFLWDRQFRFQGGVIAQRTFGDDPAFTQIDPWIQLLWQPVGYVDVALGNLNIPHDYLSAIFYSPRLFLIKDLYVERGMQLLLRREHWNDDLFFNYRLLENADRHEKFDFGFIHHNDWKGFLFTYQAHWTHYGGDNFPHAVNVINDTAQTAGLGVRQPIGKRCLIGVNGYYLYSHDRADSDTPALNTLTDGHGEYLETYFRFDRLKLIGGFWRGHRFSHEDGDEYFRTGRMRLATAQYDVIVSQDFTLFGEVTGYFIGGNDQGYSHFVKPTFLIRAAWHFSVPARGWRLDREADGPAPLERWDAGL